MLTSSDPNPGGNMGASEAAQGRAAAAASVANPPTDNASIVSHAPKRPRNVSGSVQGQGQSQHKGAPGNPAVVPEGGSGNDAN
jgi:hypothetical protein